MWRVKNILLKPSSLQIRLSECLEKTRRYYTQITGKKGMVIKGKVDKTAFEEAFKAKGIERSKDVETFLANMTGDKDGIIHLLNWSSLLDQSKELREVLQVILT